MRSRGIIVFVCKTVEEATEKLQSNWVHKTFLLPSSLSYIRHTQQLGEISKDIIIHATYK